MEAIMEDNIRITIPTETFKILASDREYFNLASMNDLYCRVIKNYYRDFPINHRKIEKMFIILKDKISSKDLNMVIKQIVNIDIKPSRLSRGLKTSLISLRITNEIRYIVDALDKMTLKYDFPSLVSILREILISYSNLRLAEKEKIVLNQEIADMEHAISKQFECVIQYHGKKMEIQPYMFITPVDDFSKYLVAKHMEIDQIKILKLSDIKDISIDELRFFTIDHKLENELNKFKNGKTTVFNSETVKAIKAYLKSSNIEDVFPYLLDEARNYNDEKVDLVSKVKN